MVWKKFVSKFDSTKGRQMKNTYSKMYCRVKTMNSVDAWKENVFNQTNKKAIKMAKEKNIRRGFFEFFVSIEYFCWYYWKNVKWARVAKCFSRKQMKNEEKNSYDMRFYTFIFTLHAYTYTHCHYEYILQCIDEIILVCCVHQMKVQKREY